MKLAVCVTFPYIPFYLILPYCTPRRSQPNIHPTSKSCRKLKAKDDYYVTYLVAGIADDPFHHLHALRLTSCQDVRGLVRSSRHDCRGMPRNRRHRARTQWRCARVRRGDARSSGWHERRRRGSGSSGSLMASVGGENVPLTPKGYMEADAMYCFGFFLKPTPPIMKTSTLDFRFRVQRVHWRLAVGGETHALVSFLFLLLRVA